MLSYRGLILALSASLVLGASAAAATFTVTSSGDEPDDATADGVCHTTAGTCTLRAAIMQSNATAGTDGIAFAIPGSGVQTILLATTTLPAITDTVIVNGYTQPGASPNTLAAGNDALILIRIQGSAGLGSGANGLLVQANGCVIQGLEIVGFSNAGISIDAVAGGPLGGHAVQGNSIHGNPTGIFLRAPATLIGGTSPAQRNTISGSFAGIDLLASFGVTTAGTLVQGNTIVSSGDGLLVDGPVTIGGSPAGAGNLLSGNDYGIYVGSGAVSPVSGLVVKGNTIGLAWDGSPMGNGITGIFLGATAVFNTIGGTAAGEGNVLADNGSAFYDSGPGVIVFNVGNSIRGNRIFGNRGLGILLAPWSSLVHPNDQDDADAGPNDYQNYPILAPVLYGTTTTTVPGTLRSVANTTFDIDFYSSFGCTSAIPRDSLQGETYLGSIQVTTDGTGKGTFNAVLPVAVPTGTPVTATATNPNASTSEFSQGMVLTVTPSGPAAGGGQVDISGSDFLPGATVRFGTDFGTNVTLNYQEISVTAPARPAGTVSDVTVTNPDGTFGTLVGGYVADYSDVPPARTDHAFVVKLLRNQVTAGCSGGLFCPDNGVTRAQMAVFLLRSKDGACFAPPPATGAVFNDVPAGSFAAAWIEALAARGVTIGCGGGNYCPGSLVTRAQMAVFLLRTLEGPTYVPPPCTSPTFSDLSCSSPYASWVEELYRRGITAGCGGGNYCPGLAVTRGQMAVFLTATFGLP